MTPPPPRGARLVLVAILVAAALLRLLHWWTLRDAPFVGQPVLDSEWYDNWGRRLVTDGWLSGDRAFFQAPLYPHLLGLVYTVAGPRRDAVYLLQIAVAVAAVWAVWRCGLRLAGWQTGLFAAGLLAFSGLIVFHDSLLLKESLATSAMAFLLLALVAAREAGAPLRRWLAAGVLLGLIASLRENAMLLVPLLPILPWIRAAPDEARPLRRTLAASALVLLGVLLAMAPFMVRNLVVTGEPLITSFQGGLNVWLGNNPDADGTFRPLIPGRQVPDTERAATVQLAEEAMGRRLSPQEVSRYWLRRSLAWAVREPGAFLRLQLRKVALFWSPYEWPDTVDYAWMRQQSPALRLAFVERTALSLLGLAGLFLLSRTRQLRRWAPVPVVLFGWMGATVVFYLFSRHRLPAIPPLALLAAVPLARLATGARPRPTPAWAAGVLATAAAFALPHVLMRQPSLELVHGNLGHLAEQRGDAVAAETHYRAALAAAPDDLLALLGVGNAAARGKRYDEALAFYRRAATAHPGSPEAFANVGAAELALGHAADAERDLRRALILDPAQPQAKRNLELLLARRSRSR